MLPQYIETERLVLRCWTLDDLSAMHEAVQDSLRHLATYMVWAADEPLSPTDRASLIQGWQRQADEGSSVVYGVFRNGQPIGGTDLRRCEDVDTLAIGYWIHVAHVRRGYATELARALTEVAFTQPGIDKVLIEHHPENLASRGIPERLGFVHEGFNAQGDLKWTVTREAWNSRA